MNKEQKLKELEQKKLDNQEYYMSDKGHEELEELEHQIYLLRHPVYTPLLSIREHIFNAKRLEKHKRPYVLSLLKNEGYSLTVIDTYGNELPMSEEAHYYRILKDGKRVGALSFLDDGRISMFSCNQ